MKWQPLIDAAHAARDRAHAPYSGFRVGAALWAEADDRSGHDGAADTARDQPGTIVSDCIVSGCNVENRSFGLTICAERSAVVQAVLRQLVHFRALVVVADLSPPAAPCGMCRETLAEFATDLPVLLVNLAGERRQTTLGSLFPDRFDWSGPQMPG